MATCFGRLLGHLQANTKHYVYRSVLNGIPFRFTLYDKSSIFGIKGHMRVKYLQLRKIRVVR
jgi:hypothetical protein